MGEAGGVIGGPAQVWQCDVHRRCCVRRPLVSASPTPLPAGDGGGGGGDGLALECCVPRRVRLQGYVPVAMEVRTPEQPKPATASDSLPLIHCGSKSSPLVD